MKFTFDSNSLRGVFDAFVSPVFEVPVKTKRGSLRIQMKRTREDPVYYLRLGSIGAVNYYRLEESEVLDLADALVKVTEQRSP